MHKQASSKMGLNVECQEDQVQQEEGGVGMALMPETQSLSMGQRAMESTQEQ